MTDRLAWASISACKSFSYKSSLGNRDIPKTIAEISESVKLRCGYFNKITPFSILGAATPVHTV